MADGRSRQLARPRRGARWTSFVASPGSGRAVRGLQQEGNALHRARIEFNRDTLLIHVSDEDGVGWTTIALDRATREWAVAQRRRQQDAAESAYRLLYSTTAPGD